MKIEKYLLIFHLNLKKGNTYAIIGPSGVGKTTLAKLILNYYPKHLYDGEIRIDGRNIAEINSESLYKKIAFVQKMIFLWKVMFQTILN
ncbi:ATP-binding cassette domain-containing protein [Streptococcus equi]|uniref:ATP-binding cassette domain-containing protein n=1 Tax=Streptococcus equi TaxID=1336 RepID=UPI0022AB9350|nr:ATP-binding cassette domain-containing protein [Streptococcus equi]